MTTKQDLITEALDLAEISPPKPKFHVWVEGYGRAQLHHHLDIRPSRVTGTSRSTPRMGLGWSPRFPRV